MKEMKPLFLLIIGFLFTAQTRAQSFASQADSLRNRLKVSQPDTNRVNLLLALGHVYIFKLSELTSDLDTALRLSRQAYALSRSLGYAKGQGLSYLNAAQAYREKKELQKAKICTQRAIDLLTKHGSLVNLADAYIEKATYYTVSEEGLNQAIRLNGQVVSLLRRAGDKLKLANELVHQGDLYQLQSNNVQSLNALREALALYQSVGYAQVQNVYDRLGFVSSKTGNYEAGIRYILLAMKTAEEVRDSLLLGEVYNRLGITYKELNQSEKALLYFNKSLLIAGKQHYKSTIILLGNTISDMADIYSRTGRALRVDETLRMKAALAHLQELIKNRPADKDDIDCRMAVACCFVDFYGRLQHQYALAQPYCDQLEDLLKTSLGDDYQLYIHGILIPFYVSSRHAQKAYQHLARNEIICQKKAYTKQLLMNHLWWFKLDSAQACYPSAITHYQRYKILNDSLLSEITTQKVAQLEVQYRTQEKERNILQLRQQSKSQQGELQKAQTTRNLSIVSAVMLVLLLGLSYNRYRLKQRSNQLLETKQHEINLKNRSLQQVLTDKDNLLAEKEWMLKEIHHRVKNNLQIITSLLHSQGVYLKDQAAVSAIRESQNRVHAMALIHQKLYQSDRLSSIPMNEYIAEIVDYLITSFDRQDTVKPHFDVAPIDLDVTLAVPLGLIINEAVTNSLKYGFPGNQSGTVYVELAALSANTYRLMISDNGIGLPADLNPNRSRTLGLSLIRGLSKQLSAGLQINSVNGVQLSLVFTEEKMPREEPVTT
jgi:two-component sensor histidine kinase/tetratricopeptide (TPR) repeat protein